jgi:hypothetical protein
MVATSAATLSEKQASSVTFATVAANAGGPFVRGRVAVAGQFDGYGAEVLTTEIRLYKYTAFNYNGLSGSPSRIQIGSTYTATINNTAIKVYVNGTERISATDATWATGQPGVFVTSTGVGFQYIDDYEAIELTPVAGGGSPLALGIDDGESVMDQPHRPDHWRCFPTKEVLMEGLILLILVLLIINLIRDGF